MRREEKSNSSQQRDLGTGYLGYNKDANCGHDGDKLGVCIERRGTAVGTGPYVGGGGGRPRDGSVRKELCVCWARLDTSTPPQVSAGLAVT